MGRNTTSSRKFAIIGVPSSAGARRPGQEQAPSALRASGLVDSLEERGVDVFDRGDLPKIVFRPDPENPRKQNLGDVGRVARNVAAELGRARGKETCPVVLGGDCTITIGVVAGLLGQGSSLGLLYLDGDLDLNTPETTPSGIFDGMVTAHLVGRGDQELALIGPEYPLLQESHLVYFGYNVSAGSIDTARTVCVVFRMCSIATPHSSAPGRESIHSRAAARIFSAGTHVMGSAHSGVYCLTRSASRSKP